VKPAPAGLDGPAVEEATKMLAPEYNSWGRHNFSDSALQENGELMSLQSVMQRGAAKLRWAGQGARSPRLAC